MKRPERKRVQRHRRTAPPQGVDLAAVADEAVYVGSPEHKMAPLSPAILPHGQTLLYATHLWQISGTWFNPGSVKRCAGAGSYECGEESALLESLEGKRGVPRIRPPFPAVVGAFQCPTVLNNVETFCAAPAIILNGGAAFAALGVPKAGGTKLTCLTGHINKPGVYELRLGFPVQQMIEEVGGGMRNGRKLKAFIPGGSSCPVLTAEECEGATMDYDSMAQRKSMRGWAAW